MQEYVVILFSIWMGLSGSVQDKNHPLADNIDFRAVKYSIPIDYSPAHDFIDEEQGLTSSRLPRTVLAYQYFIQYGKNVVIDILDPGQGKEKLGIFINKWDYSKGEFYLTHYLEHVRKYNTIIDTFQFSIDENRGTALDLCNKTFSNSICDSVKYVSHSGDKVFSLLFKNKIPNLTTHKLFYPDVKYLPFKIIDLDHNINNTLSLEKVIYGKPAIDSLLQLFSYDGYDLITNEDLNAIDRQSVIELMEKYKRTIEHSGRTRRD